MKYLILYEAADIIGNCDAVIIDDDLVTYPVIYEQTGEDENVWLYMSDDGHSYKFIEQDTPIKYDGQNVYMQDDEGDEVKLTLLYSNPKNE